MQFSASFVAKAAALLLCASQFGLVQSTESCYVYYFQPDGSSVEKVQDVGVKITRYLAHAYNGSKKYEATINKGCTLSQQFPDEIKVVVMPIRV